MSSQIIFNITTKNIPISPHMCVDKNSHIENCSLYNHISMGYCKKDVTPLLTHWSYVFSACRFDVH